jgi:tetratricopeptide (TPR) repeat protein
VDLDPRSLDNEVRGQLRALARGVAEQVSLRLVATGQLLNDDPEAALEHALIARRLASRIPAVREAVGLAAYRAGEWQTAIGELRAYHRMSGRSTHLAILADCERALGRPERAIDMYRAADADELSPEESTELLIVAAGARADLGQREAAVAMLQVPELSSAEPWVARLRYAYADALLGAGRTEEARAWFARAAEADEDDLTDAAERLLDLDGVLITDLVEDDADDLADPEGAVEDDADGDEMDDEDDRTDDEAEDEAEDEGAGEEGTTKDGAP